MTQIDTRGPANSWLQGAQVGLSYRAQDQREREFEASNALAQQTRALQEREFAFREQQAAMELQREQQRSRVRADLARGYLAPRGGMPYMTPKGPFFTPPGEDDDFHAMLDDAGDDPVLMEEIAPVVMRGAEARVGFRSYLSGLERDGMADLADPESKGGRLIAAAKRSWNPRTIDMVMNQLDAMQQRQQAIRIGQEGGIPPEIASTMKPQQVAAEVFRRQRETEKNQEDTRGSLLKQFEGYEKMVLDQREAAAKKKDAGEVSVMSSHLRQIANAKIAVQRGLVTKDGWAVLNDGQPNAQGFIEFFHPSGRTYQIDPKAMIEGKQPQGEVAAGRAPRLEARSQSQPSGKPRKATQDDINEIVSRVGKDKNKVLAEMDRLGLTAE